MCGRRERYCAKMHLHIGAIKKEQWGLSLMRKYRELPCNKAPKCQGVMSLKWGYLKNGKAA